MLLGPTAKARRELHPGVQTLTMRQRSVLLLAERRARAADLQRLFHGMGEQIVSDLVARGYLAPEDEGQAPRADRCRELAMSAIEPIHDNL